MEAVLKIKDEKKDIVPSIVHVDQTCRVQSVSVKNNLKFYNLIKSFYKLTDVPILLNTSFNENEPIVCSPKEALECFLRTQMDDITIDNFLISRKN
jgi:carbamoyltransferase